MSLEHGALALILEVVQASKADAELELAACEAMRCLVTDATVARSAVLLRALAIKSTMLTLRRRGRARAPQNA